MSKVKSLTLNNLKSDSNQYFKKVEKVIESKSGKQYKVVFKPNIKETDVATFFADTVKKINYCTKNGIAFNTLSTFMYGILDCCVELPKIKKEDILDIIATEEDFLDTMLNMGIYEAILKEIGKEKMDAIAQMIFKDENKELLKLLNNEQVTNFLLNNDVVTDHEYKEE